MTECKGCGLQKLPEDFYGSNKSRCKICICAEVRRDRQKNAEHYREYDRQRYQNNPSVRKRHHRYQATEAGKLSMKKAQQKWLAKNPVGRAAHIILGNAVRDGRIEKPSMCQECGCRGRINGHHEDYAKPLVVIWLCSLCHRKAHE